MFRSLLMTTVAFGTADALKCLTQESNSGTCTEVDCTGGDDACLSVDLGQAPSDTTAKVAHTALAKSLHLLMKGDAASTTLKTSGCISKAGANSALYNAGVMDKKPDGCTTCTDAAASLAKKSIEGKVTYKWNLCSGEKCNTGCKAEGATFGSSSTSSSSTTRSATSVLAVAGMAVAGFFLA